jgi:hypothetical protein
MQKNHEVNAKGVNTPWIIFSLECHTGWMGENLKMRDEPINFEPQIVSNIKIFFTDVQKESMIRRLFTNILQFVYSMKEDPSSPWNLSINLQSPPGIHVSYRNFVKNLASTEQQNKNVDKIMTVPLCIAA